MDAGKPNDSSYLESGVGRVATTVPTPATRVFAPRFWDVISSSYMPNISFQYRPSHTAGLNGRVESYLVPLSSRPLSHE